MLTQHLHHLSIATPGRGLHEITAEVTAWLRTTSTRDGLLTLFIRHTSASLLIQENADPEVRADLDRFFARLVPDGDPLFRHRDEGPDDMPAHVRTALTATSLAIPVEGGRLALGTWQGIYLWAPAPGASAGGGGAVAGGVSSDRSKRTRRLAPGAEVDPFRMRQAVSRPSAQLNPVPRPARYPAACGRPSPPCRTRHRPRPSR